jgi:diphthine-ammonia ligase
MLPRAAISWSGGKDSYLALHRSQRSFHVVALVTMFGEDGERSRSHGLRPAVLEQQAARLGLPLFAGRASWDGYEAAYRETLARARTLDITHVLFGDIMYDSNREFPERVCAAEQLTAVEPLWGESTDSLYREFVSTGADARIVTVRDGVLGAHWLGRRLTEDLLPSLLAAGVDPCGEHGEYHTVVVDAPLFSAPLDVVPGAEVQSSGCWALDFTLVAGGTEVPPLRDAGSDVEAGLQSRPHRASNAAGV